MKYASNNKFCILHSASCILFLALCILHSASSFAQPQARRNQQQQQQKQSSSSGMTTRARIAFPTAQSMDEDVVWRRDLYRELDLADDANGGLYYPTTPQGSQMNLFTYMFKLMLSGQIKAYEYKLDGNEHFTDSARIKPMQFLKDYDIYYEKGSNGRVRISDADIPSARVKKYYIKETSYYDQKSSTFHTQVLAICPILEKEDDDDWGEATTLSYPLFWVKYDELAPFLSKQTVMTSNLNNAATMSMDDFFTKNMYKGKIYKTVNMQGKKIYEYCKTDEAIRAEQLRIENEIAAFEKTVFGDKEKAAAQDSTAAAQADGKKGKKAKNRRTSSTDQPAASTPKQKTVKSKPAPSSSSRVTVRRQRH